MTQDFFSESIWGFIYFKRSEVISTHDPSLIKAFSTILVVVLGGLLKGAATTVLRLKLLRDTFKDSGHRSNELALSP